MLSVGRYLLGVIELGVLVGFAWLGAASVRGRLVPRLDGPVAQLATALLAIAGLLWVAEALGTFGWFKAGPYLVAVVLIGGGTWGLGRGSSSARSPQPNATHGSRVGVPTLIALAISV